MEEKNEKLNVNTRPSKIVIQNRCNSIFSGVTKVFSSTENAVSLSLQNDNMIIEGNNLHILKLDIEQGIVELEGKINSLKFSGSKSSKNFLKRIFS